MKNKILVAVILLLPLGLFLLFWMHPVRDARTPAPAPGQSSQDITVSNALNTASPQANAIIASNFAAPAQTIFYTPAPKPFRAPAGKPQPLEFTNFAPEIALDNMRHVIKDYGSMFGGNPVGNNAEITSQLMGQNPRQANFIRPDAGMRVNSEGELVDPWGTPYFFHQLSGTEMEIHSAGPDKIMWTDDDLVIK
jgi:hypothetical protein